MKTLTYKPTYNPITNVHGNQQSISDTNTQRTELDKGMITANSRKCKLNSQQSTNASWLVITIKATLKIPIQKFEKPIFSFKRTHEAAVRNIKILAAFKGDLGAAIDARRDSPFNYGSRYHLVTIKEETRKSDLDEMILRGNHKSSQSVLNAAALNKATSKEVGHGWALPLTTKYLQSIKMQESCL